MPEPFQFKKAFDVSPVALGKSTFSVAKGLLILVLTALCGYSIWVALIQPHTKYAVKTQSQVIVAKPGSTVNVQQKQDAPKRRMILFTEPYVGVATGGKAEVGIRGGCRWEF